MDLRRVKQPDELLEEMELADAVMRLLDRIPERHRQVIEMRYGMQGRGCTYREIAEELEFSAQRARTIEKIALKRMRYFADARGLKKKLL